jgi:hypothetical protein
MKSLEEQLTGDAPTSEPAPRCPYRSRLGTTCDARVVEGEHYCVLHGASVTRAQDQILRKMLALQEKAVTSLEDLLVCSMDDKVRLAAATAILDRTGLGPKSTLQVDNRQEDLSQFTELEVAERAEKASKRLRELHLLRMHEDPMNPDSVTH